MTDRSTARVFLRQVQPGVTSIVVDNPTKRNALTVGMREQFERLVEEVANSEEVRLLVVTGEGDHAFVSGGDVSEFEDKLPDARSVREVSHHLFTMLQDIEKPTIARIQGACYGIGVALAASCDLRVSSENAAFCIPTARLGAALPSILARPLIALVGPAAAKEVLFTGRRYSAREAKDMGLVNQVVPEEDLDSFMAGYVEEIASNAPLSLRAAKLIVDDLMKDPADRDESRTAQAVALCADSEDFRIGRRAFKKKAKPVFTGR